MGSRYPKRQPGHLGSTPVIKRQQCLDYWDDLNLSLSECCACQEEQSEQVGECCFYGELFGDVGTKLCDVAAHLK